MAQRRRMEFSTEPEADDWAKANNARIVWGNITQSGYYAEVEFEDSEDSEEA